MGFPVDKSALQIMVVWLIPAVPDNGQLYQKEASVKRTVVMLALALVVRIKETSVDRKRLLYLVMAALAVTFDGGGNILAQGDAKAGLTGLDRAAVLDLVLQSSPMRTALQGSRYRVFAVDSVDSTVRREPRFAAAGPHPVV